MTFIQRRFNVDATSWRCINVEATLYRRHVSAGGDVAHIINLYRSVGEFSRQQTYVF